MKQVCIVCQKDKDIEKDFRLASYVSKAGTRRRDAVCKMCRNQLDSVRKKTIRMRVKALGAELERCYTDRVELLVSFHRDRIERVKSILKAHHHTLDVSCAVADKILK